MLKFPCICGHPFTLDEGLAGSQLQCPSCGRLVDVPTLGEIHNITPEGTYIMDMTPARPEPQRLRELHRAFAREKVDETGFEIDLRPQPEDLDKIGLAPIPLADEEKGHPAKPRYDPITGELIRPLHVGGSDPIKPSDIPMAKPVLIYATGQDGGGFTSGRIMYELLLPHNLIVLLFMALFHVICFATLALVHMIFLETHAPLDAGFYFLGLLPLALFFGMIGHYSNIVQETGPAERDEIPRPLRYANLFEDVFQPFANVVLSCAICYGPALVVLNNWAHPVAWIVALALATVGACFFPAILITVATSGTWSNLRPDRVWGVITTARWNYLPPLAWHIAGMALYAIGVDAIAERSRWKMINFSSKLPGPHPFFIPNVFVGFGVLLIGMFLLHVSCWQLGLLWRAHHANFPWIAQRHTPLTHKQKVAENDARRAAARQKYEERQKQQRALRQIHMGPPR